MRTLFAAAACALLGTACGGNAPPVGLTGAAASPGTTGAAAHAAPSGAASPTAHAPASGVAAGGAKGGAAASATPQTNAAQGGITLTLGAACVVPGGRQSLTITTGAPSSVSYDTRYADGSLGSTYGGVGISRTAADGTYRTAWTVSTAAPAGTATVSAGASRNGYLRTAVPATFTVAAHC